MRSHVRNSFFPATMRKTGSQGESLIYLDTAATALMPEEVIRAMGSYEARSRSNVHRGVHRLGEESTDCYEGARERVAAFLNVKADEVIFTKGATDGLNLLARGLKTGAWHEGRPAVVFEDAHHANLLPWQMAARRLGASAIPVRIETAAGKAGRVDESSWYRALEARPAVVALTAVGNVTGRAEEVARRAREAHDAGAIVVLDGAQAMAHERVRPADLGVDALAFSAHKMYGPMGIGALWCAPWLMEHLEPVSYGGGMAATVTLEGFSPLEAPACFEAGTPAVGAAVGFACACDLLDRWGCEETTLYEHDLVARLVDRLSRMEAVRLLGSPDLPRAGLVSFTVSDVHPHDVAAGLDRRGIAVRAGHHCARPLHSALAVPASVRASLGVYNEPSDVDRLCEALEKVSERFGRTRSVSPNLEVKL